MLRNILNLKAHLLLADILKRRNFLFGKELDAFEKRIASFCGTKYAVGTGSGTDSLVYSLKALGIGIGDEVIVPAMSFAATAFAVAWAGAQPVFVDIEANSLHIDPNRIAEAITSRTRAILVVHLHGYVADMSVVSNIAQKHKLSVIVDAAQTIGAKSGDFGTVAALSFSPLKILSTFGDGGVVLTNSENIARKIFLLRNYGARQEEIYFNHEIIGTSSRLDNFRAGILNFKLDCVNDYLTLQQQNCAIYDSLLGGVGDLTFPQHRTDRFYNGYHYVVRSQKRNQLLKFLRNERVDAKIHYPVPLPFLKAFHYLGYKDGEFPEAEHASKEVLSLPTNYAIKSSHIQKVAGLVKKFFANV